MEIRILDSGARRRHGRRQGAAHCRALRGARGEWLTDGKALRDIALAEETGCPVHIAHVSHRETLDAVRAVWPPNRKTCPSTA
ncbi:MAG: hypothetical protein LBH86_06955 [Oscillospiraceae bacterium]|nr:hypothetical protein [Oscillospiraceae bacterium]